MRLVRLRFRDGRTFFDHRDGRKTDVTEMVQAIHRDLGRRLGGESEVLDADRYLELAGPGFDGGDLEALMMDLYALLVEAADDLVEAFEARLPAPRPPPAADPLDDEDVAAYLPAEYVERRQEFHQARGFKETASDFHFQQETALQDDIHRLEREWAAYQVEVFERAYRDCPLPWVRERLMAYIRQAEDALETL